MAKVSLSAVNTLHPYLFNRQYKFVTNGMMEASGESKLKTAPTHPVGSGLHVQSTMVVALLLLSHFNHF